MRLRSTLLSRRWPGKGDPLAMIVRMMVIYCREIRGIADAAAIMSEITRIARAALEDEQAAIVEVTIVENEGGAEEIPVASMVGVFRKLFDRLGFDRTDLRVQESLYVRIVRAVDQVLAQGD
jgi:hypothetical protein